MYRFIQAISSFVIRVLSIAFVCASHAHAQGDACTALTDAAVKQIMTPHHGTITSTIAGKTKTSEFIGTATTRYLLVNGKWTSHAIDVKKEAEDTATAMKTRSQTCKRLGEEALDGHPATVYAVHSNDADSDSKVWIATAGGLLLGQDIAVDGGGKGMKNVTSIRYDYDNVRPPAM